MVCERVFFRGEAEKKIEFFGKIKYNIITYEHFCGGDETIDLQREDSECDRHPR